MEGVSRICPICRASNPVEAQICQECEAELEVGLPALPPEKAAVPWREVATGLALAGAALALKAGLHLLRGGISGLLSRPTPSIPVRFSRKAEPEGRRETVISG